MRLFLKIYLSWKVQNHEHFQNKKDISFMKKCRIFLVLEVFRVPKLEKIHQKKILFLCEN